MNSISDLLIQPWLMALLAFLSGVVSLRKKYWENVIPRFAIVLVYLYASMVPDWDQNARQFAVRWSLALLLSVEVVASIGKYFISHELGKRWKLW